ncbi:unnamed protein product [Vitrella brassicaformis CCMP3155]|uniref:Uncharacterized protein n=1 Tax=Vitrella brassicaformis (strain CCMP3155) TaxID=1169540 RepID=A0A0G4GCN1_VITBC|nr:unnamed protein product [Vitrella brassicaformis CCMP3155]|eukprot:CEM26897.1 unnamed protein product [Vitrella brassicaformis CCMP3155]
MGPTFSTVQSTAPDNPSPGGTSGRCRVKISRQAAAGLVAVLFVLTVVLFALNLAFNFDSSRSAILGEEVKSVGKVSDKYDTPITPAGSAFAIWGVIYLWNTLLLVFALYDAFMPLVCGFRIGRRRHQDEGDQTGAFDKHLLTPLFYVSYSLACVSNAVWVYVWTNEMLGLSVLFLLFVNIGLWGAIAAVFWKGRSVPEPCNCNFDAFTFHALVVNGLFIYATWVVVALLLNLISWVTYDLETLSAERMATVSLSILICAVALWFAARVVLLRGQFLTLCLFTDFAVLLWALSWSLHRNYDAGSTNTILTIAPLVLIGVCFILYTCLWLFVLASERRG